MFNKWQHLMLSGPNVNQGVESPSESWNKLWIAYAVYAMDKNSALLEQLSGTSWEASFRRGILTFNKYPPTKIQILGNYYRNNRFWEWAWASHGVDPGLSEAADKMRQVGIKRNVPYLTKPSSQINKNTAHSICLISSGCIPSSGYYALEVGNSTVFVLLDSSFMPYTANSGRIVQMFKEFTRKNATNHQAAFYNYASLCGCKCEIQGNITTAKLKDEIITATFKESKLVGIECSTGCNL